MRAGWVWTYFGIAALITLFGFLAFSPPEPGGFLSAIGSNYGIAALVTAAFALLRFESEQTRRTWLQENEQQHKALLQQNDHAYGKILQTSEHLKNWWLQRDDQQFQVGVTSHMANVVFDKHVVFCEEYMAKVRQTVETLLRNHATLESVGHANDLYAIRLKHAAWVTTAMSTRLSGFEDAVRKIGAMANFVETTRESPQYAEQRAKAIEFVYSEFQRILPQHFGQPMVDGVSSESIEGRVREMLGIEALVELRHLLIRRAHTAAQGSQQ
jgi:hypothetical protein